MKLDSEEYGIEKKEDGTYESTKTTGLTAEMLGKPGSKCGATIGNVEQRTFNESEGPKLILTLNVPSLGESPAERVKPLALNRTNLLSLVNAFGDDTDEWLGKALSLNVETTQYQGKNVPCVRVYAAE